MNNIFIRPVEGVFIKLLLYSQFIYDSTSKVLEKVAATGEIIFLRGNSLHEYAMMIKNKAMFLFYYPLDEPLARKFASSSCSALREPQAKVLAYPYS